MKPLTLILIVAVVAGGIALFQFTAKQGEAIADECPGHWHSGYTFFVNNQRVRFSDSSFQNPVTGHAHHIHADDGVYHFHPGRPTCYPLTAVGQVLDFSLTDSSLTLGAKHLLDGTYAANATHQLKLFYDAKGAEDWKEVAWSEISAKQMKDGDRLLVTYGQLTPEMIAAQKAQATDMSRYVPTDV